MPALYGIKKTARKDRTRSKTEYRTVGGKGKIQCVWKPEWNRIKRIVVKNARGHAFYEYGEPMLSAPEYVGMTPIETLTPPEREEFENFRPTADTGVFPELGSRMMTRMMTGQDLCDGWVIVQEDVYRYSVAQCAVMRVRSVLFEYLATEVYWSDH